MIYSANYGLKEPQKNVDLADVNDINYNTEAIDGLIHNTQVSLAPAYDHTLTYEVGDLVMYETLLYECITAVTTPEAWDSTKWQRAYLSENAGGGGNANVTEISYSQYSLLTPAEKANGTIYMVTDDPNDSASGGGGGGVNYSTTEQNTGLKWIDGKDIYQKSFTRTNQVYGGGMTFDTGVSNIDTLINDRWCVYGAINVSKPVTAEGQYIRCVHSGNGILTIGANGINFNAASNRTWTLTIWYTKAS
jgi:hypothetical protein